MIKQVAKDNEELNKDEVVGKESTKEGEQVEVGTVVSEE